MAYETTHRITASHDQLAADAGRTVAGWLSDGFQAVEKVFGEGYASAHPELVAAFLTAAATWSAGTDQVLAAQIATPLDTD